MIWVGEKMTSEILFQSDDDRWNAVVRNDLRANGVFFYAVKTTGVYCLPSCSSRPPKRSNVEFFGTSDQAEGKGYRACKKCKPESFSGNKIPDAVVQACNLIDNAEEPLSLDTVAEVVGLSPFYFHRLFKKTVGVTPKAYAATQRAERFREGLRGKQTVTEAIYDAGYGASSRCYETVGDNLGMTPTQYMKGGVGQTIQFAVVECSLGWVAVAATERGICMIEFGDDAEGLTKELAARFAEAKLRENEPMFLDWVSQVVAFVESPSQGLDLPLDIQGTVFQCKVWEALQRVPVGTTATYAAIAEQIGKPTAARAVAGACAANKLAVAIPCHRIVRNDGTMSGYRWGTGRKRELLDREAEATAES
jgi:AraC family transcriptional regulator of adaptative response/methylated-DNA-[protein]-cysteine methyltransferase